VGSNPTLSANLHRVTRLFWPFRIPVYIRVDNGDGLALSLGLGITLPFSPELDNLPLRTPWPLTTPEPSACSRIEDLLDRLPIIFDARNLSNERILLEAPVSQTGASNCNGVM
jgi:hypothetical protein